MRNPLERDQRGGRIRRHHRRQGGIHARRDRGDELGVRDSDLPVGAARIDRQRGNPIADREALHSLAECPNPARGLDAGHPRQRFGHEPAREQGFNIVRPRELHIQRHLLRGGLGFGERVVGQPSRTVVAGDLDGFHLDSPHIVSVS